MNLQWIDLKNETGTLCDNESQKYHKQLLLGPFLVKSCALPEAVVRRCSIKKHFNNFVKFCKAPVLESSYLIKLQADDLELH